MSITIRGMAIQRGLKQRMLRRLKAERANVSVDIVHRAFAGKVDGQRLEKVQLGRHVVFSKDAALHRFVKIVLSRLGVAVIDQTGADGTNWYGMPSRVFCHPAEVEPKMSDGSMTLVTRCACELSAPAGVAGGGGEEGAYSVACFGPSPGRGIRAFHFGGGVGE